MSLLAEHEITRLISLTTKTAKTVGIQEADDPELQELAKDVHPEQVPGTLDKYEQRQRSNTG